MMDNKDSKRLKILYVALFENNYDDRIIIQKRKKAVIEKFQDERYEIDSIYARKGKYPLEFKNGNIFYSKLLYMNKSNNFFYKIHHKLFAHLFLYPIFIMWLIAKTKYISYNSYDKIIVEGWASTFPLLFFVSNNKIIVRIYGTGQLTEKIEKNKFNRVLLKYLKMKKIVISKKVKGILFNSTGSRSKDLYNILIKPNMESNKRVYFLTMSNKVCISNVEKKNDFSNILNILHVSTLAKNRGTKLTLEIFDDLINKFKINAKLTIIGDGPQYKKLQRYVINKGLSKKVVFTRRINIEQITEYYKTADLLINYYGYNPVIEALNNKTFVITREFGEIGKLLSNIYDKSVYRVILTECPQVIISRKLQNKYKEQVLKTIFWYIKNRHNISNMDFEPKNEISIQTYAKNVFNIYKALITNN